MNLLQGGLEVNPEAADLHAAHGSIREERFGVPAVIAGDGWRRADGDDATLVTEGLRYWTGFQRILLLGR